MQRFVEAEKALRADLPEAAFLLAWSAHEAAIREVIAAQGVADSTITGLATFSTKRFQGVISRDDYKNLREMLKYRNAIVHGFSLSGFRAEFVVELIEAGGASLMLHRRARAMGGHRRYVE